MYCYIPAHRYGADRVARVQGLSAGVGDLVLLDELYGLVLGEQILRSELIEHRITPVKISIVSPQLLSEQTMEQMFRLVEQYFCSYDNALSLRVGSDLHEIMKRKPVKKSSATSRTRSIGVIDSHLSYTSCPETSQQQVIVFPDIWTMYAQLPSKIFTQPGVAVFHGGLTLIQQTKLFRQLKQGAIHTLLTTHAGIFQDRYDLEQIILIDAHKRRYKSQQDPRYWTLVVLAHLAETLGADFAQTGYSTKKPLVV